MKFFLLLALSAFSLTAFSQSVGIGTAIPNSSAQLDISSTSKGVLFPRMTTAQRDAISNPGNGLHIYNTSERSLNYYDSVYSLWNSYSPDHRTVIITITSSSCKLDLFNNYAKFKPANSYLVIIPDTVTLTGCYPGDPALLLTSMPDNTLISIRNYGTIAGAGGNGGIGYRLGQLPIPTTPPVPGCPYGAGPGGDGGAAIVTATGIIVSVLNYGIIAGGGGGGGGGHINAAIGGFGGGGGGGAGTVPGDHGTGGYASYYCLFACGFLGIQPSGCYPVPGGSTASNGMPGTITSGGIGGNGYAGGGTGGTGGARGQNGMAGAMGTANGGNAGKAIEGSNGNSIINAGAGQVFGIVQ